MPWSFDHQSAMRRTRFAAVGLLLVAGFAVATPAALASTPRFESHGSLPARVRSFAGLVYDKAAPAVFPPNVSGGHPSARFYAISCSSPGNCTGAGSFSDNNSNTEAFTETSKNGRWARAVPAVFAAGVQSTSPDASFGAISCPAAGDCTAAGNFEDGNGNFQAFTETSKNGHWAKAVPAAFSPGVQNANPDASLDAVSCPSAGNCTAAGQFEDVSNGEHPGGAYEAFTQTSKNGVWGIAEPAAFLQGEESEVPEDQFVAISCASAGNCTAAGQFHDTSLNEEAFTETSNNGVWGSPTPAAFGPNVQSSAPNDGFNSVSCKSAGNCTAAGCFIDINGNQQAFTETSKNGAWADVVPASFGPNVQDPEPSACFSAISCGSAGNCTAAGQFEDSAGNYQAFTQTSKNGVWAKSAPATFGPHVQNSSPYAYFNAVSCASAGDCTAAGTFKDVNGNTQAFTETSTKRVWAKGVPAVFRAKVQNADPDAVFYAISCKPAGNCTAAGRFHDASLTYEAFTQTLYTRKT